MKKILFVTGNKDKVLEAQAILSVAVKIAEVEVDEVQSMDLAYVARRKVEAAYSILHKPVIIDDVGFEIEAWNGLPGPLIKFFQKGLGNKRFLELVANETNRNIKVQSAVAYHDGSDVHVFIGEFNAKLATEERGTDGWGFDNIVIPEGETKTLAELGTARKNELSHRRKALDKLKEYLDSQKA